MSNRKNSQGFGIVAIVIVVLVVALAGLGGWYVFAKNHKAKPANNSNQPTNNNTNQSSNNQTPAADPSEGGKYLVVEEWSVRVVLPADLQGKLDYKLGEKIADPDGNQIQAAKVYLKYDQDSGNECAVVDLPSGSFIDTAAQILQVEKNKPFDASRYRFTFKSDVLTDDTHVYHINYTAPDCASDSATEQIKELQDALVDLKKIN